MKKRDLIKLLAEFPDYHEVMILDGYNGGGTPREINLGPMLQEITDEDADDCADCEGMVGNEVIVLGYGCY